MSTFLDRQFPNTYKQFLAAAGTINDVAAEAGLSPEIIELVMVRISQINSCPTCLSVHGPQAREVGISQVKLDVLPAWHNAEIYSEEERAALQLAEALNGSERGPVDVAARETAAKVFNEKQIAALQWAAVTIEAFNKISIASGHPVRK